MGKAKLRERSNAFYLDCIELSDPPPPQLDFKLIVALPRPQMLKRILQTVAIFGVKELIFIHSQRVEKSFWQSPSLQEDNMHHQMVLGLEQAKATQLPKISLFKSFKHFIGENCSSITEGYQSLIADIGHHDVCPSNKRLEKIALAIGPEGGFVDYEIEKFIDLGFSKIQLGERVLKVETAISSLLGRLF